MTPEQAAHEAREAVVRVPGRFMADPATYVRGAELGFEGLDFYAAGRGVPRTTSEIAVSGTACDAAT